MELTSDKNWDALAADLSKKNLPTGTFPAGRLSVSSKQVVDAVELASPPPTKGPDYSEPDQKVRIQSGETTISDVIVSTQDKLIDTAVSLLIVLSTTALVLEPVVSGKADEQTEREEQIWEIVEAIITSFLTVEVLARFATVVRSGLVASGHSVATLVIEALATLPLYMDFRHETHRTPTTLTQNHDALQLNRIVKT
eukprot:5638423-Amphidinium_carterae.1